MLKFKVNRWIIIALIVLLAGGIFFASRNTKKQEESAQNAVAATPVRVDQAQRLFESTELVTYPGIIEAETEAAIIAKTNGTASTVSVNVGDHVELGQELVKIDDINGTASAGNGFSASQIKQAEVGVQQALTSLQLAQTNYATTLQTSSRDLHQAEIAMQQSSSAQQNLQKTTDESLKTAQSSYETAKLATEQARVALENRKKSSDQSTSDAKTNADVAMSSAIDSSASIISAINAATGVEVSTGGIVAYRDKLGTLDAGSSERAHESYVGASDALNAYRKATYTDQTSRLAAVQSVVDKTKQLVDDTKYMLDKTIASTALPQTLLSTLQGQVGGYQTQINGVTSQITQVGQMLANTDLSNSSTLDALQKAYEIAQQQEETARQNVENLKAGNTTQTDQANFAVQSAQNQLSSTKTRLDGQVSSAKSQVDLADMQYKNALLALQNVSDAHRAIAPISGVVVTKSVSQGDTVSQGQVLAVVGTPDRLKTSFYIDQDSLSMVMPGQEVTISLPNGQSASGTIVSVAPQADAATHRYKVEVRPTLAGGVSFPLGSVVDVSVPLRKVASQGTIIVPLSAVDVTSNGSFIMIANGSTAQRIQVEVARVLGEVVEIKAPITPATQVIIDGNRLINDGSPISIQ